MTRLGLEYVTTDPVVDRNFRRLDEVVPDFGGVSSAIRIGVGVATWGGFADYVDTNVDHGLGVSPVAAFAAPNGPGSTGHLTVAVAGPGPPGQLAIRLATVDGTVPAAGSTTSFSWIAAK